MREAQHLVVHVPKSPGVAVVLSFFWSGLGQLYAGAIGKGLAIMVAPVAILVLWMAGVFAATGPSRRLSEGAASGTMLALALVGVCFWAWQLFDAYVSANDANRRAFGGAGRDLRRRRRR